MALTVTGTMRALGLIERPSVGSTASALRWVELPMPSPAKGQVCIAVDSAALNIDDVHIAEATVFGGGPMALPRPSAAQPVMPRMDVAGVAHAPRAR